MTLQEKIPDGWRRVQKTTTVAIPRQRAYDLWRDVERFPLFMKHLESVTLLGHGRSHWIAKGPAGTTVEWDAEVTAARENEFIAWESLPDSDVPNGGQVRFRPAPFAHATEIRVTLFYKPPAGSLGVALAKVVGEEPSQQLADDLHRFKQLAETGRVPTTEGQPVGGKQLEERRRELRESVEMRRDDSEEVRP